MAAHGACADCGLALPLVGVGDVSKRILLGRKLRSSQLGETLLPKRIALPVFASDALSSVAYAPDEIFIMLSLAGRVGVRLVVEDRHRGRAGDAAVVASYRQTVHAYPSGGGDYEVATVNLGANAGRHGRPARCSSTTCSPSRCRSPRARSTPPRAIPLLVGARGDRRRRSWWSLLMAINLRGVRESGTFFAVPDLRAS